MCIIRSLDGAPYRGVKREDRCKAVAAPATVSVHRVPLEPLLQGQSLVPLGNREGSERCLSIGQWSVQGLGASQETCHRKEIKAIPPRNGCVLALYAGGVPGICGCAFKVRFLCRACGKELVAVAPCLPLASTNGASVYWKDA